MATSAPTPRYLFRCSSDQSNGINTPDLFAPGSLSRTVSTNKETEKDFIPLDEPTTTSENNLGHQLRQALLWKKDQADCPFVFFTTSPIFVVQLAVWRSARKTGKDGSVIEPDTNVNITIIDTETALTSDGHRLQFHAVQDLLNTHNVELKNRSDGSLRACADHWATISSTLVPGPGSHRAALEDLVMNGLYELYPQIEVANDRRHPRPSLTTDDLRKYFFHAGGNGVGGEGGLLVSESLDTAGRLGMCFSACERLEEEEDGDGSGEEGREGKEKRGGGGEMSILMAFVLSLRKMNLEDLAFQFWLQDHTTAKVLPHPTSTIVAEAQQGQMSGIPDADEFIKLERHFTGLIFEAEGLAFGLSIDPASIEEDKADWRTWWKQNREDYRATHTRQQKRQGWRDRQRDRPRELLERRARRDRVVDSSSMPRRNDPTYTPASSHQSFDRPHNALSYTTQTPRELFPGWRHSSAVQPRNFDTRARLPGTSHNSRSGEGFRVLESRPGDVATTRHQRQHERVRRRRDGDGNYVRERRH